MNNLINLLKTKQAKISICLLLIVAIFISWLSYVTIWQGDDISYGYSYIPGQRTVLIRNISDIIASQIAHYQNVNGRIIAVILFQLFCGGIFNQWVFAVVNGLVYFVFFLILAEFCSVSIKNIKGFSSLIILSLIAFQTKMMPSCQICYIWMFTLTLLFLYLFFDTKQKPNWLLILLLGIYSFIAGLGQEALNIGVCGALIIYWATNIRLFTVKQYVMTILFGIGTLADILSPGTLNRAGVGEESTFNILTFVLNRAYFIIDLRTTYILIAVTLWQHIKNKIKWKEIYNQDKFLWNTFIILILFMLFVGNQGSRMVFGADLVAIILSLKLLRNNALNNFWLSFLLIITAASYFFQVKETLLIRQMYYTAKDAYFKSTDGKVYLDLQLNRKNFVPERQSLSKELPVFGSSPLRPKPYYENQRWGELSYDELMFQLSMSGSDTLAPPVRIIPPILMGKEKAHLGNQVHKLGRGYYLLILDKEMPAKAVVTRRIQLPGYSREFPSEEINNTFRQLCEGDHWRAYYVDIIPYSVANISTQSLTLK